MTIYKYILALDTSKVDDTLDTMQEKKKKLLKLMNIFLDKISNNID